MCYECNKLREELAEVKTNQAQENAEWWRAMQTWIHRATVLEIEVDKLRAKARRVPPRGVACIKRSTTNETNFQRGSCL